MSFETLHVTVEGGVAHVRLARPDKHNALSSLMMDELIAVTAKLSADPAVRAVVLSGEGKSFCAGGDLGWMRDQFTATRAGRIAEARRLAMTYRALDDLRKPVIAKVNGNAFGGGVGLLSVCDLVISADTAKFGLTEVRLGIIPATISPFVIARIGVSAARGLFMSGKLIDAQEAAAIGLVNRAVPADALDEAVDAEIGHLLQASPEAASRAKALLKSLGNPITDEVIDRAIEQLADTWETAEAQEGVTAFFEKRAPSWRR